MTTLIVPREVPLGGYRSMMVRRTLPARNRAFIGAWCFLDHYGPHRVGDSRPTTRTDTAFSLERTRLMDVAPHPHTGLQTATWLFQGSIEHRDSLGTVATVHPGELNLMTAGAGICHSEVSTPQATVLHGVQLWIALPAADRDGPRAFTHHAATDLDLGPGSSARVFLGQVPGWDTSPVATHTPLLGVELTLAAHQRVDLPVDASFEHGVLVDGGTVDVAGTRVGHGELLHLDPGRPSLPVRVGDLDARLVVLGGTPFEEEVLMWWNFLGGSQDEIEQASRQWNSHDDRFGEVPGYLPALGGTDRIPAPAMPAGRLLPTVRRGRRSSVL